jgi:hypothetical protein
MQKRKLASETMPRGKRQKNTDVQEIKLSWGIVSATDIDLTDPDQWFPHIAPHFLTHSTIQMSQFEFGKRSNNQYKAMDCTQLGPMLLEWLSACKTHARVFSVEELREEERSRTQQISRGVRRKDNAKLLKKSKDLAVGGAPCFKSQRAQETYAQIASRTPQDQMLAISADGSRELLSPAQGSKAFAQVGGHKMPVVRGIADVQRDHRAQLRTLFSKAEHPQFYVLVYTDDSKEELSIHLGDDPPLLPFGLLIPPHRSLEIGLRTMGNRDELNLHQIGDQQGAERLFSCIDVGDGTDRGNRNICIQGFRLVETRVAEGTARLPFLGKPTPLLPVLLFYGKESEQTLASPFFNCLKSEFLNTVFELLTLTKGFARLKWNGKGAQGADSKWLWICLSVRGQKESVCYLCEVPRADYGKELGHAGFRHCTTHQLACRYLTSLFELQLLVKLRARNLEKAWTVAELGKVRVLLTNEHGSIGFPADMTLNSTAHAECCVFVGTELLVMGPLHAWTPQQTMTVIQVYVSLLVAHAQVHNVALPILSASVAYSLKQHMASVPIAHDLKQILKHLLIDKLFLAVPGGKERTALRSAVLKAAQSSSFIDFFYTKSAYKVFLCDRSKWDVLPHKALLLVRMLEIICDQAISSDISLFQLAVYSACVFLYQAVVHVLEADDVLYEQNAKDKKTNKDFLAEGQGSMWFHSFSHSVHQLEETMLPFSTFDEGVADHWLGQFKLLAAGREQNRFEDLQRVFQMMASTPSPRSCLCLSTARPRKNGFSFHSIERALPVSTLLWCSWHATIFYTLTSWILTVLHFRDNL